MIRSYENNSFPCHFALVTSAFRKGRGLRNLQEQRRSSPPRKEADGIIGDFVIRNTLIECLIGGSADNRKANMGAFWDRRGDPGLPVRPLSSRKQKRPTDDLFPIPPTG